MKLLGWGALTAMLAQVTVRNTQVSALNKTQVFPSKTHLLVAS